MYHMVFRIKGFGRLGLAIFSGVIIGGLLYLLKALY